MAARIFQGSPFLGNPGVQLVTATIPEHRWTAQRWRLAQTSFEVHVQVVGSSDPNRSWVVSQRSSAFSELYATLKERFPKLDVPNVPNSQSLGRQDKLVVESRRRVLNDFLEALMKLPVDMSLCEEVCQFLNISASIQRELVKAVEASDVQCLPHSYSQNSGMNGFVPRSQGDSHGGHGGLGNENSIGGLFRRTSSPGSGIPATVTSTPGGCMGGPASQGAISHLEEHSVHPPDASCVKWFLNQLQVAPNTQCATLRTFQDFVLKSKPIFTAENVRLLYLGQDPDAGGGLLRLVGNFEHSEVSSIAALSLLAKLVNNETCHEASLFTSELQRLEVETLSQMQLATHIERNRSLSTRLDAYAVLRALKFPRERLLQVVKNEGLVREFWQWEQLLATPLALLGHGSYNAFRSSEKKSDVSIQSLHMQMSSPSPTSGSASMNEASNKAANTALTNKEYKQIAQGAIVAVRSWLSGFRLPPPSLLDQAQQVPLQSQCASPPPPPPPPTMTSTTPSSPTLASPPPFFSPQHLQHHLQQSALHMIARPRLNPTREYEGASSSCSSTSPPPWSDRQGQAAVSNALRGGYDEVLASKLPWRMVRCPEPSWTSKYGVRAGYVPLGSKGATASEFMMRLDLQLPFPASHVACLLADHAEFVRCATAHRRGQFSAEMGERVRGLMEGNLVAHMQHVTSIDRLQLGGHHEAFTELLECLVGAPSAAHISVRLWVLTTLRLIQEAPSISDDLGSESGQSGYPTPRRREKPPPKYLFVATAIPPIRQDAASKVDSLTRDRPKSVSTWKGPASTPGKVASSSPSENVTPAALRQAGNRSVNSRAVIPGHTRNAALKHSGIQIEPLVVNGSRCCRVSFCALLGKESVSLVSADLLGERALLWRTLENIIFLLELLCPLAPSFRHSLLSYQGRCMRPRSSSGSSDSPRSRTDSPKGLPTESERQRGWPTVPEPKPQHQNPTDATTVDTAEGEDKKEEFNKPEVGTLPPCEVFHFEAF